MAKRTIPPEPRSAQEKSSTFRHIVVRSGYYEHHLLAQNPYLPPKCFLPVPWLQMKGYWLNKAGFNVGTKLIVEVQKGCIIIKPEDSIG